MHICWLRGFSIPAAGKSISSGWTFALISEIPFNLFISDGLFYPWHQNVFFIFVIGLCMMAVMETIRRRVYGELGLVLQLLTVIAASGLAWVTCTDYQFYGSCSLQSFTGFPAGRGSQCLLGLIWQMGCEVEWILRLGVAFSFLLLYLYNGERGKRRFGYVFYLFYPAHLLVLSWIYRLMG